MCKFKKRRPAPKNQNQLDKTAGESSHPELTWSEFKKTIFTPEEIAAVDAKVSARGMSWDEYEKANYTPEEIAASEKRVAKMCKKIERKQRRRGL